MLDSQGDYRVAKKIPQQKREIYNLLIRQSHFQNTALDLEFCGSAIYIHCNYQRVLGKLTLSTNYQSQL